MIFSIKGKAQSVLIRLSSTKHDLMYDVSDACNCTHAMQGDLESEEGSRREHYKREEMEC